MSRQSNLDNHANQLNPNNDAYWQSRGEGGKPEYWEEAADSKARDKGEEPDQHGLPIALGTWLWGKVFKQ